jgi:uracil-DNA glycosylase
LRTEDFVRDLAAARIGTTCNFYRDGPGAGRRRGRLAAYLDSRRRARLLLVGEAAGYRGARVSGIPFTSERQLTGDGPAEASATVVHGLLAELGLEREVMLWNVVPTHPGNDCSNRRPTRAEIEAGLPFLREVAHGRTVIAAGRIAQDVTGAPYVRHPSRGGAGAFRRGFRELVA